jgi:hypothetical protein
MAAVYRGLRWLFERPAREDREPRVVHVEPLDYF